MSLSRKLSKTYDGTCIQIYRHMCDRVPEDFDWIAYRSLNKDLARIVSEKDAIKHYKVHGYRQNRPYSFQIEDETENEEAKIMPLQNQSVSYVNKINGVPLDFDWIAYKSLNRDLSFLTSYVDAVKHYREHGSRQSRPYTAPREANTRMSVTQEATTAVTHHQLNQDNGIPVEFDWLIYRSTNQGLQWIKTYQDAVKHYKEHGCHEPRIYCDEMPSQPPQLQPRPPQSQRPPQPLRTHPYREMGVDVPMVVVSKEAPPADFNWLTYRSLNPDLLGLKTQQEAIAHYLNHGKREDRPYKIIQDEESIESQVIPKFEKVATDHDWIVYRQTTTSAEIRPHGKDQDNREQGQVPHDFDWTAYRNLNSDLAFIRSYQDAVKHYREHGYKQNRPYSYKEADKVIYGETIPTDFNWVFYRSYYSDLNDLSSEQDAVKHYVEHGIKEGRKYNRSMVSDQDQMSQDREQRRLEEAEETRKHEERKRVDRDRRQQSENRRKLDAELRHKFEAHKQDLQDRSRQQAVNCHGLGQCQVVQPKIYVPKQKPVMRTKPVIRPGKKKAYITREPIIVSTPNPSKTRVPNIIHLVYGFKEQTDPFGLCQYIAIMSAHHVNKPDHIYFHYKYEPHGPYWDQVKPYLTLKQVTPPETIFERKVIPYAHKADIVRLEILNEVGGIYLDMDTMCLRPVGQLMAYEFVMGLQGNDYGLCNAIMLAQPKTEFGKQWYKAYESYMASNWDLHSVKIPYNLSKTYPITVLPNDALFWPTWDPFVELMLTDNLNCDCYHKIFRNAYCIHLWDRWNCRELQKITEDNIYTYHSLYNIMARKFLRNYITIVMILEAGDDAKAVISVLYQVVSHDLIHECLIYDQATDDSQVSYLDNLPNINHKFTVIKGGHHPRKTAEIKAELFTKPEYGIIMYLGDNHDTKHIDSHMLETVVDLMYDESIGMVGFAGGTIQRGSKGGVQVMSNVDSEQVAECLVGWQIFRTELRFFGLKIETQFESQLSDLDLSFQVRNLGKVLMLLPSQDLVAPPKVINFSKDQWSLFNSKWKSYPK